MADKKYGRVVSIQQVRDDTRLITLQLEDPPTIEFVGGQYVIAHSEAEIGPGKVAKGTFTIISPEAKTDTITLAVKQLPGGPCSTWLNQTLKVGDRLGYSGPWGAKNYQDSLGDIDAMFVATDTGINATIGFLNSNNASACLHRARVLWLLPSRDYFLDIDYVRDALPEAVRDCFRVEFIAEPGVALRVDEALQRVEAELQHLQPRFALLSGDGEVLTAIRHLLTERGFGAGVVMEPYFNKPEAKDGLKKNSAPDLQQEPARQPLPKQQPESL